MWKLKLKWKKERRRFAIIIIVMCISHVCATFCSYPIWINLLNERSVVEPKTECLNGCNINNHASFPRRWAAERLPQLSQWQRWGIESNPLRIPQSESSVKTESEKEKAFIPSFMTSWLIIIVSQKARRHNKDERTLVRCQEVPTTPRIVAPKTPSKPQPPTPRWPFVLARLRSI